MRKMESAAAFVQQSWDNSVMMIPAVITLIAVSAWDKTDRDVLISVTYLSICTKPCFHNLYQDITNNNNLL